MEEKYMNYLDIDKVSQLDGLINDVHDEIQHVTLIISQIDDEEVIAELKSLRSNLYNQLGRLYKVYFDLNGFNLTPDYSHSIIT